MLYRNLGIQMDKAKVGPEIGTFVLTTSNAWCKRVANYRMDIVIIWHRCSHIQSAPV